MCDAHLHDYRLRKPSFVATWEARWRKKKDGHAMPFRALEDAAHAMVSETGRLAEQEQGLKEEKGAFEETAQVENVRDVEK